MVFMFLSGDTVCVLGVCACLSLSAGGIETLHIKQPGTTILSDVSEHNEIQVSQRASELQCVEQQGSM